jgi:pimeloyl-ACP methyl ester carboxylesterase
VKRDWAFHADDGAVLDALAAGTHAGSLREYFGAVVYPELAELAAAAGKVRTRAGPRVLILPGIMGSRLGGENRGRSAGVLWLDPPRIADGGLKELKLPAGKALRLRGVLLFSYAKLLLELKLNGCDAAFFPYDWRLGLDESGAALAARIAADGKPAILIAHSMGGLVARMAAGMLPPASVPRLILVGTPNHGSFAPLQALRGSYPFVRWLARLDRRHSPRGLAAVFGTFPGLHQLLPMQRRFSGIDLSDPECWPKDAPTPNPKLLEESRAVLRRLAPPDSRTIQIVGINQETIVGVRRTRGGFEYALGLNGDGTVPVASALLPKVNTYFVDELHGNLPNNPQVIQAVIDLVRRGRTAELARHWVRKRAKRRYIDDAQLRRGRLPKIDWRRLDSAQREAVLAELDAGRCRAPTL